MATGRRVRFAFLTAVLLTFMPPASKAEEPARPNIILIGWDTLRADHVGARGERASLTPNLDALARKGSLFTNAVSPSSWTLPVFMSWFTSLYPGQHAMTNKFRLASGPNPELAPHALDKDIATLPQVLKERGYETAGFTGGAGVSAEFGFDRGFDVYEGSVNFAGFGLTVPRAMKWLQARGAKPFFLFVHGYDCHPQAALPTGLASVGIGTASAAGFQERHRRYRLDGIDGKALHPRAEDESLWKRLYDQKVRAADTELGRLLSLVEASPRLRERTIIVVAGDHGDELFEHGHVDHGMTLYDELIHVPMVIFAPGIPARTVKEQVRTLDILPTILKLADIPPGSRLRRQMRGTSLVAHMRGQGAPLDAYSETDYLFHTKLRSLRRPDGWKLILDENTGASTLFDLNSDPLETHDRSEEAPARASEMKNALLLWMKTIEPGHEP